MIMRALIQRVSEASVTVEGKQVSAIKAGLLLFIGIEELDNEEDIAWLSGKIVRLRIFDDENGLLNTSLQETGGDALVVSQFTLHASTKKGNRPSYSKAAKPEYAHPLYEQFVKRLESDLGKKVGTGVFGAYMKVVLLNDGPITIFIDSKQRE